MNKTFLLGMIATVALTCLVGFVVSGVGVSPDLGAFLIILGLLGTGLIGGEVSKRMPPPPRRR